MMTDRRTLLKQLAKGAVYAAPVVYTLSTPRELQAIVTSGMFGRVKANNAQSAIQGEGSAAPWDRTPAAAPWGAPAPWEGTAPGASIRGVGGGD